MGQPPVSSAKGSAAQEHPDALTDEQVNVAALSFVLLADPTRVRMLWALRDQELDVASLAGIAGCRPTVASQHLSKLRFAGLVEGHRDGRRVLYRLRGSHVRALLKEALFHADTTSPANRSTTDHPAPCAAAGGASGARCGRR